MVKEEKITDLANRTVVGVVEKVTLIGTKGKKTFEARIDTGAAKSSVDEDIAKDLDLGPVVGTKKIKNANGIRMRPIIETNIEIKRRQISKVIFTVANRKKMKYPVLIGRNVLEKDFLVDPKKN